MKFYKCFYALPSDKYQFKICINQNFTQEFANKLNTSYLTESYIAFTLKMESVTKDDSEKWSEKIYFEIPPCMREDGYFYY